MRYAGVVVGLAALVPALAGCNRTQPTPGHELPPPADPPVPPAPVLPKWGFEAYRGIPFYLAPIPEPAPGPAPTAAEVLAGLFRGMADDDQTRALLVRLHGGARVEFRVMDGADEAAVRRVAPEHPPADGRTIFWAVTSWRPYPIPKDDDKRAPGISRCLPMGLGWTYLSKLDRVSADPTEILALVCNDYLLRHQLGYQIRHDSDFPPAILSEYRPDQRAPEAIRTELDREIARIAKQWDTPAGSGKR